MDSEELKRISNEEPCLEDVHNHDRNIKTVLPSEADPVNLIVTDANGKVKTKRLTKVMATRIKDIQNRINFFGCIKFNEHRLRQGVPAPSGDYFAPTEVRDGIMPSLLKKLIKARSDVKKELKRETDPVKKVVLNERQLSIKLIANSVYGFCGVSIEKGYAMLPLSAGVAFCDCLRSFAHCIDHLPCPDVP